MKSINFSVPGKPISQGSMMAILAGRERCQCCRRPLGRPVMVSDQKAELRAWRKSIAAMALTEMVGLGVVEDAVMVKLTFYWPKPQKPKSPYVITHPDVDKLARAALDALTGVVWKDDAQVVWLQVEKRYGHPGFPAGVAIQVDLFVPRLEA